jgi:hypothetical protein
MFLIYWMIRSEVVDVVKNAAWLVQFIREQASGLIQPFVHLGKVRSVNPLRVRLLDVELDAAFLLVEDGLNQQLQQTPSPISVGDDVVLLPIDDGRKFIVTCKVVNPT